MKDFVIYTDSTCDLSEEMIEKLGVKVIPMEFTVGDKTYMNYSDEREISAREFYDKMRGGDMAVTSLINMDRYMTVFEPELEAGMDVLYLCFSSGLSGSYNNALLAIEELREKYPKRKLEVVDTRAASLGEGLFVYNTVMENRGKSLLETAAWANENRDKNAHWFTVEDLVYLKRGGRVSAAAALVGGILNIKPVLHVDDEGHLIPMMKVRGRKTSLDAMVTEMEKTVINPEEQMIFIGHGDCLADAEYVRDAVKAKWNIKDSYINNIGPVIGAHSGPGTLALFFMGTKK
ncbi:MAG: DegV family protein [Oscillospiraceae bacterium]